MALSTIFLSWTLPCSHLHLPKTSSRSRSSSVMAASHTASAPLRAIGSHSDVSITGTVFPAFAYSTILYFKSTYNVHVTVGDDEPEDQLINRFRKEVFKAGVLQECRRRRFFETKHDKIKRKAREASRRNRRRKQRPRVWAHDKRESAQKKYDVDEDNDFDNWELPEVSISHIYVEANGCTKCQHWPNKVHTMENSRFLAHLTSCSVTV